MSDLQPDEFYTRRAETFRESARELRRRARALSNARLAAFSGFIIFGLAAELRGVGFWIPAILSALVFLVLVVQHRRARSRIRDVEARAALCDLGLARRARKWSELPVVVAADAKPHPYAHDLDLFGEYAVTQLCGPLRTHHGRRQLRSWLAQPSPIEHIRERQDAIQVLRDDIGLREELAVKGGSLDAHTEARLSSFLKWVTAPPLTACPPALKLLVRILPFATFGLIAMQASGITDKGWWTIPLIISAIVSLGSLKRIYAEFDAAFNTQPASLQYSNIFAAAENAPQNTLLLKRIHDRLHAGTGSASFSIKRLESIMMWSDARHSPGIVSIMLEILFLWSFQTLITLQKWQSECKDSVADWFNALGELEALSSLATLSHDQPTWCFPVVTGEATRIEATRLGHPMLSDTARVHNDVAVGPRGTLLLVTGSNMSGKSTLLRAVGVNTALAHAGAPVCAEQYTTPLVRLYTSINVHDSLTAGVSLYMAQLSRLKEVLDAARHATPHEPCCYLLDEILSGTNSADRTTAVRAVLNQLLQSNAIGVVTTHDLAVAADENIQRGAENIHFAETIDPDQGTMTFDYRVRPGPVQRSNALELMRLMGIPVD